MHICKFNLANPVSEHEIEFAYLIPNAKIFSSLELRSVLFRLEVYLLI